MNTPTPRDSTHSRIEPERPGDATAIGRLTTAAFAPIPFSDGDEARVVDDLRAAGDLTISLVAVDASDQVIGHVAFSPVRIDGQPGDWYALGPVSVAPALQRRGLGSALIARGLDLLSDARAAGCVLLGNPDYYRRFGFLSDPALTYRGQPNPYFQRLVLHGPTATGDASFHPAFDGT